MSLDCPVRGCGYGARARKLEDDRKQRGVPLTSTRSSADEDAHRDMDGFKSDEELARLRSAVAEMAAIVKEPPSPQSDARLRTLASFVSVLFENIDEHLVREGRLPEAWSAGLDSEEELKEPDDEPPMLSSKKNRLP